MEQPNLLSGDLQVDSVAYTHLKETARWAKFLSIIGFILSGFLVLIGIFSGSIFSSMGGEMAAAGMMGTGLVMVIYIIIAIIYIMLSLYLYRFATKMQYALQAIDQQEFNDSLHNLKRVYKIMGILVVVYLGFMALVLIFGLVATMFS